MTGPVRNVLVVLALAAIVMLVPGGGDASAAVLQALFVAMFAALAWFAVRLYREHRADIYALGERNRGILYASVGLAALTLTATDRLWATGPGTIVWLALIGLAGYGVYSVYRASREY